MTIPAAWSICTRTASRVANTRPPTPKLAVRACSSVTSSRSGSCTHTSAWFTGWPASGAKYEVTTR